MAKKNNSNSNQSSITSGSFNFTEQVKKIIINLITPFNIGEEEVNLSFRKVLSSLRIIGTIGLLGIFLTGILFKHDGYWPFIGLSIITAAASSLCGAMLGFIFGIPKFIDKTDPNVRYKTNTNLEDISDWLTKIIIGISLIELKKIIFLFNTLVISLASSFDFCGEFCKNFSLLYTGSLIIFPFIYGFIIAYLYTRIFLPILFLSTSQIIDDLGKAKEVVTKLVRGISDIDAKARNLVDKQLSMGFTNAINPEELKSAIDEASPYAKSSIYFVSRDHRVKYEHEPSEVRRNVIRTAIPVFESLIYSDLKQNRKNLFHTNFAQLAYIYMNILPPDPTRAIEYLNKAIEVRDGIVQEKGTFPVYEYCRAICNIYRFEHKEFAGRPTDEELKELIDKDLKTVKERDANFITFKMDPVEENNKNLPNSRFENWSKVKKWLDDNHIA